MRIASICAAVLFLAVAVFIGIIFAASESGEVVVLTTTDAAGGSRETRVWTVDYAGAEWVRSGHSRKRWFTELEANPRVGYERGGSKRPRIAVPVRDPEIAREVNARFAEKYGAADWIVALSGNAADRVVVRLDPIPPGER